MTDAELALKARKNLKLKQDEMGALLGRSVQTIHRWEAGKTTPTPYEHLLLLAAKRAKLKTPVSEMLVLRGPIYCMHRIFSHLTFG